MNEIKRYLNIDSKIEAPTDKLMALYPKIKDRIIPLSLTGIANRTFFHWKNYGIIDYPIGNAEERFRVKLNLFEYVWVNACVSMRAFGLPLNIIKDIKIKMFEDMGEILLKNKEEILRNINSNADINPEARSFVKSFIPYLEREYEEFAKENRIYSSLLSTLIQAVILMNQEAALIITNSIDKVKFRTILYGNFKEFGNHFKLFGSIPHLMISIRPIIEDFLSNIKSEKYLEKFEFFQPEESEILKHLMQRNFTELKIKCIDGKLKVTKCEDIDIVGDEVFEIKRIIGLNDFNEIDLTLRNKKHIHVKRRTNII